MFYSPNLLKKRGHAFFLLWVAATLRGERLKKYLPSRKLRSLDLLKAVEDLFQIVLKDFPGRIPRPLDVQNYSLYLSSQLMFGSCVVLQRKAAILLTDSTDLFKNINHLRWSEEKHRRVKIVPRETGRQEEQPPLDTSFESFIESFMDGSFLRSLDNDGPLVFPNSVADESLITMREPPVPPHLIDEDMAFGDENTFGQFDFISFNVIDDNCVPSVPRATITEIFEPAECQPQLFEDIASAPEIPPATEPHSAPAHLLSEPSQLVDIQPGPPTESSSRVEHEWDSVPATEIVMSDQPGLSTEPDSARAHPLSEPSQPVNIQPGPPFESNSRVEHEADSVRATSVVLGDQPGLSIEPDSAPSHPLGEPSEPTDIQSAFPTESGGTVAHEGDYVPATSVVLDGHNLELPAINLDLVKSKKLKTLKMDRNTKLSNFHMMSRIISKAKDTIRATSVVEDCLKQISQEFFNKPLQSPGNRRLGRALLPLFTRHLVTQEQPTLDSSVFEECRTKEMTNKEGDGTKQLDDVTRDRVTSIDEPIPFGITRTPSFVLEDLVPVDSVADKNHEVPNFDDYMLPEENESRAIPVLPVNSSTTSDGVNQVQAPKRPRTLDVLDNDETLPKKKKNKKKAFTDPPVEEVPTLPVIGHQAPVPDPGAMLQAESVIDHQAPVPDPGPMQQAESVIDHEAPVPDPEAMQPAQPVIDHGATVLDLPEVEPPQSADDQQAPFPHPGEAELSQPIPSSPGISLHDVNQKIDEITQEMLGSPLTFGQLCPPISTPRRKAVRIACLLLELHKRNEVTLLQEMDGVSSGPVKILRQ